MFNFEAIYAVKDLFYILIKYLGKILYIINYLYYL